MNSSICLFQNFRLPNPPPHFLFWQVWIAIDFGLLFLLVLYCRILLFGRRGMGAGVRIGGSVELRVCVCVCVCTCMPGCMCVYACVCATRRRQSDCSLRSSSTISLAFAFLSPSLLRSFSHFLLFSFSLPGLTCLLHCNVLSFAVFRKI